MTAIISNNQDCQYIISKESFNMFMLEVDALHGYYNVIDIITSNYPPVKLKDKGDCFIGKTRFLDKIHLFQYVDEKPCLIKSVTFDTDREYKKGMRELIESI